MAISAARRAPQRVMIRVLMCELEWSVSSAISLRGPALLLLAPGYKPTPTCSVPAAQALVVRSRAAAG
eukprot:scaffold1497_cov128-Isochrysis_galbana.AAC.1